jgi:lambda repressor-like predicted transcriptional regulator
MNEIQAKLAQLQKKGWTLAAIADSDELGGVHRNTIGMWKAGTRYPRLDKPIIDALNRLLKRNRIPKKKRYIKGSRRRIEHSPPAGLEGAGK